MNNKTIKEFTLAKGKTTFEQVQLSSSVDVQKYIRQFYHEDIGIYESFFLLLLNRANKTIGYAKISQGGTIGTVVDIKLVAKYALEGLAQSAIICHNHPAGNIQPSEADKQQTKRIKNALDLLEITLLDHIILTEENYYSFADQGTL